MSKEYETSYRNVLHEINVGGLYKWQNIVYSHGRLAKIAAILMIFWTALVVYVTIFGFLNAIIGLLAILGGGLIVYAIIFYKNESSFLVLFAGLTFVGISARLVGIVVVIMYTYITYQLLKVRQIKKAEKYASMTPMEISKMKDKKGPRLEVTVRGGER